MAGCGFPADSRRSIFPSTSPGADGARCAAIAGESAVETPVVSWHWNAQAQVAVAPGIACFGAGHEYAHGGVSLQESLIPSMRVTAGAGSAVTQTKITDITWVGLRCRVRVDGGGGAATR